MRVRIRRFSSVKLEDVQQPGKTARVEVSNRKGGLQSRAVGQAPGAMGTAGGLCREVMSDVRWRSRTYRTLLRFHCFQITDRNLRRIHSSSLRSTEGV